MQLLRLLSCCFTTIAHVAAILSISKIGCQRGRLLPYILESSRFRYNRCMSCYCTPLQSTVHERVSSDVAFIKKFHHVEFYCGDATNTYKRFLVGLGMELISKSDQSTGNTLHASYVLRSGVMNMVFTAPYSSTVGTAPALTPSPTPAPITSTDTAQILNQNTIPFPSFNGDSASDFFKKHGFGVKCVAVEVADVNISYDAMIQNGATSHMRPLRINGESRLCQMTIWSPCVERFEH